MTAANLDPHCFKDRLTPSHLGVYYGWAKLESDDIEPMVMSVGYNPHYGNKELSAVRVQRCHPLRTILT